MRKYALIAVFVVAFAAWMSGKLVAGPGDSAPAGAAAQPPASPAGAAAAGAAAQPTAATTARKFSHELHADGKKMPRAVVTQDSCRDCHGGDAAGNLALPGAAGPQHESALPVCDPERGTLGTIGRVEHRPCLDSGCHVREFLAVGESTRTADPARYAAATAFCQGCHGGTAPPARHAQVTAPDVYCNNASPDYHIELSHYQHTRRTGCRDCHIVDNASFALVDKRPGHAECARCHDSQPPLMSYCKSCHREPGPAAYFEPRSGGSDVRACESDSHLALARKKGKRPDEVACFRHETEQHRFRKGKALECGHCHFMIADQKRWGKQRYDSLKDVKSAPIIDNERDLAHQRCGDGSACHARDVDDRRGKGRCTLCHSEKAFDQFFK